MTHSIVSALLQSGVTTVPLDVIYRIAEGIFTMVIGWGAMEARSMKKQMVAFSKEFAEWRVAMLGIDGESGMNEDIKALNRRAYLWDKQLGDHETRLVVIERVLPMGAHIHQRSTDEDHP